MHDRGTVSPDTCRGVKYLRLQSDKVLRDSKLKSIGILLPVRQSLVQACSYMMLGASREIVPAR
jgi:hypothetical protein